MGRKHDRRKVTSRAHSCGPSVTAAMSRSRLEFPEHLDGHMLIFGQAYLLQAPIQSVGDSMSVLARKSSIAATQLFIRLEGMDDNRWQSKKSRRKRSHQCLRVVAVVTKRRDLVPKERVAATIGARSNGGLQSAFASWTSSYFPYNTTVL